MEERETIAPIADQLGVIVQDSDTSLARKLLEKRVNEMIVSEFEKLTAILYRLDVPEKKITWLLEAQPGEDAAVLIVDLMIEREREKIKSRREHRRDNDIPEEERW